MIDLVQELTAIIAALDQSCVEYAVCGALALAIHGYPRATLDVDLLILESDLPKAVGAVKVIGYNLPAGIIPFQTGTPNEQRLYRVSKAVGEDFVMLDFLIVTPVMQSAWATKVRIEFGGHSVSAVSRDGLVLMKRLAGRPQDMVDVANIEALYNP